MDERTKFLVGLDVRPQTGTIASFLVGARPRPDTAGARGAARDEALSVRGVPAQRPATGR